MDVRQILRAVHVRHGRLDTAGGLVETALAVALVLCFFFSSRRRHTRLVSDWSSDVCSSDLGRRGARPGAARRGGRRRARGGGTARARAAWRGGVGAAGAEGEPGGVPRARAAARESSRAVTLTPREPDGAAPTASVAPTAHGRSTGRSTGSRFAGRRAGGAGSVDRLGVAAHDERLVDRLLALVLLLDPAQEGRHLRLLRVPVRDLLDQAAAFRLRGVQRGYRPLPLVVAAGRHRPRRRRLAAEGEEARAQPLRVAVLDVG